MEEEKEKPKVDFSGPIKAMGAIREKEGKNRGVTGVIPCPDCGAEMRYSIAKVNGHIHAKCSGCGNGFMQ